MKTLNGTGRLIAVLALVACTAAPLAAAGPKTRYERVLAQASALRLSRRPSPLSQIRKVVAAYEVVARQHPTSGYADNALLQGAELSLAAHRIYGSAVDRESAARMLVWMISEYPHSSLIEKARALLKKAKPERPASTQVASARVPASQAASLTSMASPRVPASQASQHLSVPAASPAPAPPARTPEASAIVTRTPPPMPTTLPTPTTMPVLKNVTRATVGDMVRITMEFDREVEYRQERLEGPARLYFDLKNTQTTAALTDATYSYSDTTVRHIRLGRPKDDTTRLVIDLAGVEKYSVFELYNPFRVTIDLHRTKPKLEPLVARRVNAVSTTAPQLASAEVPHDLDMLRRIPPRPLPHPLADTPMHVASRPVSREVASLLRRRPIAGRRSDIPMSAPVAMAPVGVGAAAEVARLLVPPPLTATRRGLPVNTLATRAPKSNAVAAKLDAADAAKAEAARLEAAKLEAAKIQAARIEAAKLEAAKLEAARIEAAKLNAAKLDAANADVAKADVAKADVAKADVAKLDAERAKPKTDTATVLREAAEAAAAVTSTSTPAATIASAATPSPTSTSTAARATPPAPLPQRRSAPTTLPAPSAPSANTAGGFSLARQLGLGVARIVIDPGHGGHDPGNLGSKVNESEVVLDIALRLEKLLLNEPGFEVVMTRRTDVFIPLEERPAIANREAADLFLSIHANASRNRQASGVETYYLNFASNPEAEEVAARENSGAAQTMNHLPEIVRAIAMNNKLDESRDFARVVQTSMVGRLKAQNTIMKDRGVKQAPFVVLIGAGMPSVLAEVAFLSHQQEANLMKTKDYRQKVAEALFDAVKNYQRSLKAVGSVASIDPEDDDDQDEPRNDRQ